MVVLTPGPLVRAIFYCVFTIFLFVLMAWYLVFLYQQESSPNVTFFNFLCLYQLESSPKVVDSSKKADAQIPGFPSKF